MSNSGFKINSAYCLLWEVNFYGLSVDSAIFIKLN